MSIYRPNKTQKFIAKTEKVHGNKYFYEKVFYIKWNQKVTITCPKHGDFEQSPYAHLRGQGCRACGYEYLQSLHSLSKGQFVEKANKIHPNKNDYSEVTYVNQYVKVKINCLKHGQYFQTPTNHLSGNGCPKCYSSHGERKIRNCLIMNNISFKEQCRIKNCRNKKSLPFDFAIYQKDELVGLIEFQGKQHYELYGKIRDIHKATMNLVSTQNNDRIKFTYAKEQKIPLLVIPYWEDIEKRVKDFVSSTR
jgi:hypothetical protein